MNWFFGSSISFIGTLALLMISSAVHGQRQLSLEEAIATALQNNYDIQIAKNDSQVASIDYSYRNAVFLPSVNATAGRTFNHNNQRQTLADGTERKSNNIRSNNLQGSVGINWLLFDGFKMFATREKAAALLESGTYTARQQVVNTIAQVITTYYNIARQQQMVDATDVQIRLNSDRAKLAQYKLDIGSGTKPDVLQSMVDLNKQKALKMQQETTIEQLKEQLLQVMNSKIQVQEFVVPDTIPLNSGITLGEIRDGVEQSNPALLKTRNEIEIAKFSLKEAEADRWPQLSFGSAYNYNRIINKRVINNFSTLFNQTNGFNYGLTASIPIFNQFRVRRQIQQERLNIGWQQTNYDNQKSIIHLNILNAFRGYLQQQRALALEEDNIKLAQENVDIILETYKLGAATLLQLREAQLSLAEAYDRLIAARYNLKISETELLRLKGDIVKQ